MKRMSEEKKNPDEEEKKNPEQEKPEDEKEEQKHEEKPNDEKSDGKAPDDKQADENGEGAEKESEEKKPEQEKEKHAESEDSNEVSELKEENLKLKTQIAAMQLGFKPECMEDAVVLAENLVKQGEKDINTALSAVLKKYPEWKTDEIGDKSKGGFKVGASSSDNKNASEDRLDQAFGIKKKDK